jgi:phosphoglycerate dehydrogenase-like enzyme
MGVGLTGRTLGIVGAGSIGRETLRMARVLDLRLLAADPYAEPAEIAALGATLVPLDALLAEADFVCVTCALTPETRHLIDARALARMPRSAYLINVARGPIVDEAALYAALAGGRLAGAALDVFEVEPVPPDRQLALPNVIVTPHALCWTTSASRRSRRAASARWPTSRSGARRRSSSIAACSTTRMRAWFGG